MIIGVDVDGVVVRSDIGWYNWLRMKTEILAQEKREFIVGGIPDFYEDFDDPMDYDLRNVFPEVADIALEYWRTRNLYDYMRPCEDSIEVLKMIKDWGEKIVFVSHVKGDHHKSKYQFVERHFPFLDGFIATKEKQFSNVDVLIDDRIRNLKSMDVGVKTIFMQRGFTQDAVFEPDHTVRSWEEVRKVFLSGV